MAFQSNQSIANRDPELAAALTAEFKRQEEHLELIASENYVSPAVMQAQGSVLTNKYAEGYPGKRYYGGCEHVDKVEQLAIERVKALFGAYYANVQPHSGASANAAVYAAAVKPGDTVLGMSLAHGGHLTHGSPVNFSGRLYHIVSYGLHPQTEQIDYDEVAKLAREHQPKMIVAGASAYSRVIDWAKFAEIAKSVGAVLFVDMAHYAGLIAAGLYPNPVPVADFVSSTTHKTLRGPRGGFILATAQYEKAAASAVFPGQQGGPLMHVIAAKAVAFREAQEAGFIDYQRRVIANARTMCAALQRRGLRIVSGGTDSHLFLVDLRPMKLTGKAAEEALGACGITVNKNAVPNDPEKPMITSGIRIGTPALTTRGFDEAASERLGNLIADLLSAPQDTKNVERVSAAVAELCRSYPVYDGNLGDAGVLGGRG